jgi:hypothetical protein
MRYFRLTASVVLFASLVPALRGQTADEKKATVAYLRHLQIAGRSQGYGGFVSKEAKAGHIELTSIRATSASLRALKYFGGDVPDADAAKSFVSYCYDKTTGGFLPNLGLGAKPDVFSTSVGIMAVVEVKLPTKDYEDSVIKFLGKNAKSFEEIRIAVAGLEAIGGKMPAEKKDWIAQIEKMRNADGTFGKDDGAARDTGGAVVALLRMGVKIEQQDNVLKVLRAGQRKDGGWGQAGKDSDMETTYRVMRCFKMLKAKPADSEKLRAFIAKCRNEDGGYGVAPGQASNVGGCYFAGVVLHWMEEMK